ncbi:hypothetical protein IAQ61_003058 [Plenodomus lingam]|uniref:uncharacterized protein n=1 Tax=Leptosphaeria maculans TaxID=5022 RepID=UPI003327862A|nr:hypothetical protein IAQ61_003058 [Plenodomus lingam]
MPLPIHKIPKSLTLQPTTSRPKPSSTIPNASPRAPRTTSCCKPSSRPCLASTSAPPLTLIDDDIFATANLLDALPDMEHDGDEDEAMEDMGEEDGQRQEQQGMARIKRAVNPGNDWSRVMSL